MIILISARRTIAKKRRSDPTRPQFRHHLWHKVRRWPHSRLRRAVSSLPVSDRTATYPYIGLALALKARGHHPVLAAPEFYRRAVEQEAIDFAPFGPNTEPTDRDLLARVMHPT